VRLGCSAIAALLGPFLIYVWTFAAGVPQRCGLAYAGASALLLFQFVWPLHLAVGAMVAVAAFIWKAKVLAIMVAIVILIISTVAIAEVIPHTDHVCRFVV
jgi:hypothetical protein